jgi:hypothetical protein
MRLHVVALALVAALSACTAAQDKKPEQKPDSNDQKVTVAKGETVTELGKSVMYVLQVKSNDYWFGSNDRGVYRYDGKSIVNFTLNAACRSRAGTASVAERLDDAA